MIDGWTFRHLAREAVRNVLGTSVRMFPIVGLAVLMGSIAVAFAAYETSELASEIADLADRGRGVVHVSSSDGNQPVAISRTSCERIAGQPGIDAAGARAAVANLDLLPAARDVQSFAASTTLLPQLSRVDVLVGPGLVNASERFRVRVDDDLVVAETTRHQRDGLSTSHSAVVPFLPTEQTAPVCVIVLNPYVQGTKAFPALMAMLDVEGGYVSAHPTLSETTDPVQKYLDRTGRYFPLLLGVLGAIATILTYRLRSSELAVYRISGTSAISLLTLMTVETLLVAGVCASSSAVATLVLHEHLAAPNSTAWWALVMAGSWTTITIGGIVDIAMRRPTDLLKDR